jgi:putative transposase
MLVASMLRLLLRSVLSDRRSAGMIQQARGSRVHERWAHLRFSVIGQLLAAPPAKGELKAAIAVLAARTWQHPTTGDPVRFGFATIERWYYRARKERADPVGVLRRKLRADAGRQVAISDAVRQAVLAQYAAHKSWSVKLHHDNLVALAKTRSELKPVPSYATLRRFMSANGLARRRRVTARWTGGAERAEARIAEREVRSYEAEYVNALWHWDCHHGSRKVLTRRGEWVTPILFGVLDDRSRLACHLQWYLAETAEIIAHGLSQAFQKRGLPRSALSDNGAAMTAAEITEGLHRLGILHHTTLPYSPYQNAKQEAFWGPVEGRLIAMLEHVPDLTLDFLNEATQAWVEHEYNRKSHSEIGEAPLSRFLAGPDVTRPCPDSDALRLAFTRSAHRTHKKSDGTIVIEGRRFEVPNRYRHLNRIEVRYASWNLGLVHLVDERTGHVLARLYPQDKTQNASGLRRSLDPVSPASAASGPTPATPAFPIPPLLARLLDRQTAAGLPPAYLPKNEEGDDT